MAIVGFNLNKLSIERHNPIEGNVNVKTNLKINEVKEEKVLLELSKEKTTLQFDFEFSINYEPNIATIHFAGNVIDVEDEKEAKKILKEWKDKKLDEDLRLKISNMIWVKCNIKAFALEEELGLPVHIPLPRLTK